MKELETVTLSRKTVEEVVNYLNQPFDYMKREKEVIWNLNGVDPLNELSEEYHQSLVDQDEDSSAKDIMESNLQKENDELRAYNSEIKQALSQCLVVVTNNYDLSESSRGTWLDLITKTATQSLSEVKAEAVIGAIEKCNANAEEEDNGERLIYVSDLVDYANQLKEGWA